MDWDMMFTDDLCYRFYKGIISKFLEMGSEVEEIITK